MNYVDCLPSSIGNKLKDIRNVECVRIRNNCPVVVEYSGRNVTLDYVCGDNEAESVIRTACQHSLYAYEKTLASGFMTIEDGTRIGVAGAMADGCFKNYTSLCMRIPHVVSCAKIDNLLSNVLVIGKPNSGKTTYLRDLTKQASNHLNVVVADERGELSLCGNELQRTDVLLWCEKKYAFDVAVRSLSPDVVVCDELNYDDFKIIDRVIDSGVKLYASVHGSGVNDVRTEYLRKFDYAVELHCEGGKRTSNVINIAEISKL